MTIPVDHFPFDHDPAEDHENAARWALEKAKELSEVFCSEYCSKECNLRLPSLSSPVVADPDRRAWKQAQEEFHEALSHVLEIPDDAPDCPACDVVDALKTFPSICNHLSPAPGLLDPQKKVLSSDERTAIKSGENVPLPGPCCEVYGEIDGEIVYLLTRTRDEALLYMDVEKDLPSISPKELEKLKQIILLGQGVIGDLYKSIDPDLQFDFNSKLIVSINKEFPSTESEDHIKDVLPVDVAEQQDDTVLEGLPRSAQTAYALYEFAVSKEPTLFNKTDREVYDWLLLQPQLPDEVEIPPRFDTFTRYLRSARNILGRQKNHPRAGRPPSSGTARSDEL